MTDIKIVCTGKGQHRELWISLFRWDGGWFEAHRGIQSFGSDHERVVYELVSVNPPESGPDRRRYVTGSLYRLTCRRCRRRNTEVSVGTLVKLLDGLSAAGSDGTDMSRWPF